VGLRNVSCKRKLSIGSTYSADGGQDQGVDYGATHGDDVNTALQRLRASSSVDSSSRASIGSTYSAEGEQDQGVDYGATRGDDVNTAVQRLRASSSVDSSSRASIGSTYSADGEQDQGVDYGATHGDDVNTALQRLRASSSVDSSSRAPLSSLLSQQGAVYDLPDLVYPKAFRGKTVQGKTEINIGKHSGVLRSELGRGAYGVVVLMDVENDSDQSIIAVKAQSPIDCLAWEFEILRSVEQRIRCKESGSGPFPWALTFLALADGGVLSMTAGSKSGLNLVGLVNLYQVKLGEPIPELIALYYTSRMLKHLETLHRDGKILVRWNTTRYCWS
jgi:hypothetical protein